MQMVVPLPFASCTWVPMGLRPCLRPRRLDVPSRPWGLLHIRRRIRRTRTDVSRSYHPPSSNSFVPGSMERVDVHHHIFPASIGKAGLSAKVGWRTPPENLPWTPEISLRAMDQLGIKVAVLSLPAGLPVGPSGQANRAAAREFNAYAARICLDYPERFRFFACLPHLPDIEGVLAELRYGLDELKACGIIISSSYGQGEDARYVGDDLFDPIWEELDRRAAVVFLHGAQVPASTPHPHLSLGIPVIEVPHETFKAAAHLVVTGKKRRWPNVKIILAHLGGSTPSLAPRVAVLSSYMGCTLTPEEILEDFRTFYYDTALSSHETTLTAIGSFVDTTHLLFGTDFPAVSTGTVNWYTKNSDAFFAGAHGDLERVMHRNARALLGI
ncbi:amidohydrolase 2 [Pilatotrama ljubarskyi]|nr:amidohydrolase 2 [Pilatotrama ljubarskyi]